MIDYKHIVAAKKDQVTISKTEYRALEVMGCTVVGVVFGVIFAICLTGF